ncbi:MAG TPA: heavy metal-responsive transcriptional regulator [Thermoanaerobaculia bacterium]|nr:heavy metal-responsive transcriptional regulator [Thermoanaerobaculia bacterium]
MALTIGDVASQAGVGVETVRFYERKGLIDRPRRPASGFRHYDDQMPRRIRFIRHAQELGFSLREIRELLDLRIDPDVSCADVKAKAIAKVAEVEEKLASLARMRDTLLAITRSCAGEGPTTECPILDALDEPQTHGNTDRGTAEVVRRERRRTHAV